MKAAIFTLNDYTNFGNRLQNYAMEQIFINLGFEVVTVINDSTTKDLISGKELFKHRLKIFHNILKNQPMNFLKNKYKAKSNIEIEEKRRKKFIEFSNEYLHESDFIINEKNIPSTLGEDYDLYITGSDQVWNPFSRFASSIDFLEFAPKSKILPVAPSFGVDKIHNNYKERLSYLLNRFENISVREESGAQIIKNLTGRESTVIVDPTMVIEKNHWQKLIQNAKIGNEDINYVFLYCLGTNAENLNKSVSNNLGTDMGIVDILSKEREEVYCSGPIEFLYYIFNAKYVVTDSFHCALFSILFNIPFVVIKRVGAHVNMSTRLYNLLSKFNLKERYITQSELMDWDFKSYTVEEIDAIHSVLKFEKDKFFEFLESSLRSLKINY